MSHTRRLRIELTVFDRPVAVEGHVPDRPGAARRISAVHVHRGQRGDRRGGCEGRARGETRLVREGVFGVLPGAAGAGHAAEAHAMARLVEALPEPRRTEMRAASPIASRGSRPPGLFDVFAARVPVETRTSPRRGHRLLPPRSRLPVPRRRRVLDPPGPPVRLPAVSRHLAGRAVCRPAGEHGRCGAHPGHAAGAMLKAAEAGRRPPQLTVPLVRRWNTTAASRRTGTDRRRGICSAAGSRSSPDSRVRFLLAPSSAEPVSWPRYPPEPHHERWQRVRTPPRRRAPAGRADRPPPVERTALYEFDAAQNESSTTSRWRFSGCGLPLLIAAVLQGHRHRTGAPHPAGRRAHHRRARPRARGGHLLPAGELAHQGRGRVRSRHHHHRPRHLAPDDRAQEPRLVVRPARVLREALPDPARHPLLFWPSACSRVQGAGPAV